MNEGTDPAVTKRILEAKRVIADPSSSSLDVYAAQRELDTLDVDTSEIQRPRNVVVAASANPIEVYAARKRLQELGAVAQSSTQGNAIASPLSRQPIPQQSDSVAHPWTVQPKPNVVLPTLMNVVNIINMSRITAIHAKEKIPIPSRDQTIMVIFATRDVVLRNLSHKRRNG